MRTLLLPLSLAFFAAASIAAPPEKTAPAAIGTPYHIFAGNTHAHTSFTWSHGEQWAKAKPEAGKKPEAGGDKEKLLYVDANGSQFPSKTAVLKPDWEKFQGPPAAHFALAKSKDYDFYVTTDHSQEADLQPPSPDNPKWATSIKSALEATTPDFVGLTGFEFSENNSPSGAGHLNVINTAEYLNALAKDIDIPYLYKWLKTARPNGEGPVVACFNHPSATQYHDFDFRDPEITEIVTMLEVINSNDIIHYAGFLKALDKGWKVSPVCGNDNHGLGGIARQRSRTFVLATARTKPAILDAMRHRRTYASLDNNLQCSYTVNGAIMGSTLEHPAKFDFDISIADPDTDNPQDQIIKIDIVKDGGAIAETYTPPTPTYSVNWKPTLQDTTSKYFFVRVWNAGGGDAPDPKPDQPVAWLAPIWTGN